MDTKKTQPAQGLQPVVVMGNGPSAKLVDFDSLRTGDIASVGMNAAYRFWDRIDFRPTYYICMDSVLIQSHAGRIAELIREGRIKKFFLRDEFKQLQPGFDDHERVLWFSEMRARAGSIFDTNLITTGSWAIRWMADEGHRLVAVIGIDTNYVELLAEAKRLGDGNDLRLELAKTPKFNPNYFFNDYQQAGDRYNIPNSPDYLNKTGQLVHVDALRRVKEDFQKLKVQTSVIDCSPISGHGTFPKVDFDRLVKSLRLSLVTSFFLNAPSEELENNIRIAIDNARNWKVYRLSILFEGDSGLLEKKVSGELMRSVRSLEADGRLEFVRIDSRPNYAQLFQHASALGPEICAVANADILLDDEFLNGFMPRYLASSRPLVALTRWNRTRTGHYLQGTSANPPWAEVPLDSITYSDVNYLSYDTYVFDSRMALPKGLGQVQIGTFGCDTAIAALYRVAGTAVMNPCLIHRISHFDEKVRSYSTTGAQAQHRHNTDVLRNALLEQLGHSRSALAKSIARVDDLRSLVASFGTPHPLGMWHRIFRLLGATPWEDAMEPKAVEFRKFPIHAASLAKHAEAIHKDIHGAMSVNSFIEIEIEGVQASESYLDVFLSHPVTKGLRDRLFRYNRQSVIFTDIATEEEAETHSDVLLLLRRMLTLGGGLLSRVDAPALLARSATWTPLDTAPAVASSSATASKTAIPAVPKVVGETAPAPTSGSATAPKAAGTTTAPTVTNAAALVLLSSPTSGSASAPKAATAAASKAADAVARAPAPSVTSKAKDVAAPAAEPAPESGRDSAGTPRLLAAPRLLMIDSTPAGHTSATGRVKLAFLGDWPRENFLQIWESGGAGGGLHAFELGQDPGLRPAPESEVDLIQRCVAFKPDVVYCRPIDSERLLNFCARVMAKLERPLVVHIMDDWPERSARADADRHARIDRLLRRLLRRATVRLSICDAMSRVYENRYGGTWTALANGVDVATFPVRERTARSQTSPFVLRYMGGLADDMCSASVEDVARVVASLRAERDVRLEIYTMPWYRERATAIARYAGTTVLDLVAAEQYERTLTEADALLIAYNFDEASRSYVGLSLANKMPECLASGAPVFAYGPDEMPTISLLRKIGCAEVVGVPDEAELRRALLRLIDEPAHARQYAAAARSWVQRNLSLTSVKQKFASALAEAISIAANSTPEIVVVPPNRVQLRSATAAGGSQDVGSADGAGRTLRKSSRFSLRGAGRTDEEVMIFASVIATGDVDAVTLRVKMSGGLVKESDPWKPVQGDHAATVLCTRLPIKQDVEMDVELSTGMASAIRLDAVSIVILDRSTKPHGSRHALVEANRMYRDGEYARALRAYLALYESRPLSMYGSNALMCARRLATVASGAGRQGTAEP
jgi:glycosyltransferase involved in cell wall biosynthesis